MALAHLAFGMVCIQIPLRCRTFVLQWKMKFQQILRPPPLPRPQCCTRVENSRRESRSRENIFVSKGLVRLATPRFTRAVSSARSAARE
jgi:hypothetical protein